MKPEELRDLRVAILCELYRIKPLGRRAPVIHSLVLSDVECTVADVNAQLSFLEGKQFVSQLSADELCPGLEPYWFITSAGMSHCEEKHLV